jgi:putative ABC transport system substrate-binding protein
LRGAKFRTIQVSRKESPAGLWQAERAADPFREEAAMSEIRRREFITLIGGAAVAVPHIARSQQPQKLSTIGFLGASAPSVASQWLAAFVQKLRDLGWVEGRNVTIDVRWAEGRRDRAAEIAAAFVELKVDIIVTWGIASTLAAKQMTSVVAIVFATAADPVGAGLVATLARPGGNVTGLSVQNIDLAGKRLELLREAVPEFHRLAIMANVSVPTYATELSEVEGNARRLGLDVTALEIRREEDIALAFEDLKSRADALFVVGDPLTFTHRTQLNTLAQGARLATMYATRGHVTAGGLMSYGTNFPALFRRAADFVSRILHGAKPADIPVEQPTKFDFVINLKTAKALGLEVPPTLLARADEVIE